MTIEIKLLKEPYNFAQIADVLRKTYFREYCDAGALQWNETYTKFYLECIAFKETTRNFIFGAFDEDRLVGTIFGQRDKVIFENQLELEIVNLGLTAVDPDYKRRGIAKKLLERTIEQARVKGLDVIIAFPEKGRYGDKLLKQYEFKDYGKTQHLIKLMEDRGVQVVREFLGYNVVMAKLASLFSHLPEEVPLDGTLRDATMDDFESIREILNSYAKRVPLLSFYSGPGYKESNIRFKTMKERFEDPWGFYWLLWEQDGQIIATVSYRVEVVTFEAEPDKFESGPVALMSSLGFHESIELDDKVKFLGNVLQKIRKEIPSVYVTQITSPQHERKVLDKLKFVDDRSTYYLYMLPLTEKGVAINKYKKYKEYLLQYYR